jgi:CBS domain-containing protein
MTMANGGERVSDIMARHPASIRTGTVLPEVVEVLLRQHMTGLPVVDDSDRVVGFVSEQDCLRTLLVASYHSEGSPRVEDVMFREPLMVRLDDSVVDIAEQMVKQKPKVYPVVDQGGRLQGLLTRTQVLAYLIDRRR